jgi:2-hydroxychromene-2-carboxylate isomerase
MACCVDFHFDSSSPYGFLAAMKIESVKQRLVTENEQAIANGVFGSPFIRVDGEPFWGSDRLDDVADRLAA